ncbi:MAG: sugar phosphate nucleotidyltransferase [Bacteroidia bacterium]|nr:sugar phosphate nucleotidyltransferase [Bacteroidia bacterium]
MHKNHFVVIMAGGVGSRFWPMSRNHFPKQFQDILGTGKTLLQETYHRFKQSIAPENIYVVTNVIYHNLVSKQLPELYKNQILLEPVARNTAPCVLYAAMKIHQKNPNAVLVVTPSDHLVLHTELFRNDIELALNSCEKSDIIMTLGISPSRPDTGYGYIQYIENDKPPFKVKTFTEKPSFEIAKTFLESGDFVWNSGLFIFNTKTILDSFKKFLPDMFELFYNIRKSLHSKVEYEEIASIYPKCKNISMDYGILEKADNVYMIRSNFGWSDLGTWASLFEQSPKDESNNVVTENTILNDSYGNIVKAPKDKLIVLEGIKDTIIVDNSDVLLVCNIHKEQNVREIVARVRKEKGEQFV